MFKQILTFVVISFLLFTNLLLFPFPPATAQSQSVQLPSVEPPINEDSITYWDGNWVVESNITYRNQTIIVNGNLFVPSSKTLTLINVTLKINGTGNLSRYIQVNSSGRLNIRDYDSNPATTEDGSFITSNHTDGKHRYGFNITFGAGFLMENSRFSECGYQGTFISEWGLYVRSDNVVIRNCSISDGYSGILSYNSDRLTIDNNSFSDLTNDGIYLSGTSDAHIFNNTIDVTGFTSDGIVVTGSSTGTRIVGNTINISGNIGNGIFLSSLSFGSDVISNIINCTNQNSRGIYIQSDNSNITSNKIIAWGSTSTCIDFDSISGANLTSNDLEGHDISTVLRIDDSDTCSITGGSIIGLDTRPVYITLSSNITFASVQVISQGSAEAMGFSNIKDITIANSSLSSPTNELYLYNNALVTVINSVWTNKAITGATSTLTERHNLNLTVVDRYGDPISGANIQLKNLTSDLKYDGFSDNNGRIPEIVLTEAVHTLGGSVLHTPHNITVLAGGYNSYYSDPVIDKSKSMYIMLLKPGEKPIIHYTTDWDVSGTQEFWNETFLMDGNITVGTNEQLILHNCTIIMNCTNYNGQYHIEVRNRGTLQIFDYDWDNKTLGDASLITDSPFDSDDGGSGDYAFNFSIDWGGVLEIRNSSVHDCGWASLNDWEQGICIYSDYSIFDHVDISNRYKGIVLSSANNAKISNCTIQINSTSDDALAIHGWDSIGVVIQNNSINMTGIGADQIGILIDNINYSYIIGNDVKLTSSNGWSDGIGVIRGRGNWIFENSVYQYIDGTSIILWGTDSAVVSSNIVRNYFEWSSSILSFASPNSLIQNNRIILSASGYGLALRGDCQNSVVHNNTILARANNVHGINIANTYNNFILSNNIVNLTGNHSSGLWCEQSTNFQIHNLEITIWDQFSFGMHYLNSDNITVIGVNITTSATSGYSNGIWLEHSSDIFILNVDITLNNDYGAGLVVGDGTNSSIIASANVITYSMFSLALEVFNSSDNIIINSTLNAILALDILVNQNATVGLLNVTFTDKLVQDAQTQLIIGWFLNVRVIDDLGQPVPGATVDIDQSDSSSVYNGQTDVNGWIRWVPCLGYINSSSSIDNSSNPHLINASNATCWDIENTDLTHSGKTIVITLSNDAPLVINKVANVKLPEDTLRSLFFNTTDKEHNPIQWSINTTSSWIRLNSTTGELLLAPNETHVGNHYFRLRATDINHGFDEFDILVTVSNRAPVIQTMNVPIAVEDTLYIVDYASDDDPATTWTLVDGPDWLSLDPDSGLLRGTPNNTQIGTSWVNFSVEDGNSDLTWNNFTISVINNPPEILTNATLTSTEDQLYHVDFSSSDDGEGDITWSMIKGPKWLSMDQPTGKLSGMPTNAHVQLWMITIEVDDGNLGTDQTTFELTVINTPPLILTQPITWADEDTLYEVDYSSSDDDLGEMTWAITTDVGTWLDIDPSTGELSGTPLNEHVGTYFVNVSVQDDHGGSSWQNFTLNVNNTNDIPVILTKDVFNATEDQLYKVDYDADDDDGDIIIWSLDTMATWLKIDENSGMLSGTPTNLEVGSWDVTITADDGVGGIAIHSFKLVVSNVNDAPIIDAYLPPELYPSVEEGTSLDFNITYSDEDSKLFKITWSLDGESVRLDVPFWTYVPPFDSAGDHEVIVNITDLGGAFIQHRWIVIVTTANRAPVIDLYSPMNLKPVLDPKVNTIKFTINATDPDDDQLTYEWSIDSEDTGERTNTFEFDRSVYGLGTYNLTVTVTDSEGTTTQQTWTIDVKPSASSNKDGSENVGFIIAILIIIVVIILITLFLLMKKRVSQIEDIFVISNAGILLAHKSKELRPDMDDDILSGMLTAIQDFVKDAFREKSKFGLKRLDFGDSLIHLKRGKNFYVAVVLSGSEPPNLEDKLDKTISNIEDKYGKILERWSGDRSQFRGIKDQLSELLK